MAESRDRQSLSRAASLGAQLFELVRGAKRTSRTSIFLSQSSDRPLGSAKISPAFGAILGEPRLSRLEQMRGNLEAARDFFLAAQAALEGQFKKTPEALRLSFLRDRKWDRVNHELEVLAAMKK